ncbi:MAG: YggS family pyridoxal phosphate-dependent enzyme [Hungatella sp.]|nr:YggS family pyridoxal phosphate-dependent enzyme [Hungatella sp.]
MTIEHNLQEIQGQIQSVCARVGRSEDEVTLIAVSKTKPVDMLREAYGAGVRQFGENKVQELNEKIPKMPEDIKWHLIGHLQTNKVRQIIGKTSLIHSVDSIKLAREIEKESEKRNLVTEILLEINVAKEESKFGFFLEEAAEALCLVREMPHVRAVGLMTVAPFVANAEENRPIFRKLYEFYVDMKSKNIDNVNMTVLSMGMTGDFKVAIEEGATMVRVGTGIFGAR